MSLLLYYNQPAAAPPPPPPAGGGYPGAALDIDFTTGTVPVPAPGIATITDAMNRAGGLTIDSTGLLLNDNIATSAALQALLADTSASILIEFSDAEMRYGGFLLGKNSPRLDTNNGEIAVQLFQFSSYGGPKITSGASAPSGSRQRIVYAWDTAKTSGVRGYASLSGSFVGIDFASNPVGYDTDLGVAQRGLGGDNYQYVGTLGGALDGDAVASTAYPSPKMLRLTVWSTALSEADVQTYAALTYSPPPAGGGAVARMKRWLTWD